MKHDESISQDCGEVMIMENPFPAELTERDQWVCWKYENRDGKQTKVPYDAKQPNRRASSTNPDTWSTYEAAIQAREHFDGIGFVFTADDPYCGIDLDRCRDPQTGGIDPRGETIVRKLNSYTEISPSGTGLHIIIKSTIPGSRNRKGSVEIYDRDRFFCMTGNHLEDTPKSVEPRQEELTHLYSTIFPESTTPQKPDMDLRSSTLTDAETLEKARSAKNGEPFQKLYAGDISDYPSPSEADQALCNLLAFGTGGDEGQMDRLFRQSGLIREKWDEPRGENTYGQRTIRNAIIGTTEFYRADTRDFGRMSYGNSWETPKRPSSDQKLWPVLDQQALYGMAGDFVRLVEDHTESDPVALLTQFHVVFGNIIGRHAHFQVEADRHFGNLDAIQVGDTSKGRKGTSLGHILRPFQTVEAAWGMNNIVSGLSSGEGLIWAVRDPVKKLERVKSEGAVTYEEVDADPGILDKRLLVIEPEFAATLKVLTRDGSTLSPLIRQAWDSGNLRALTKNTPAKASQAHISIIGHITKDELLRNLDVTEAANGFFNRFLIVCVKRSKCLPDGGQIDTIDFSTIIQRMRQSITFAKKDIMINRDPEVAEIWRAVYPTLSEGKPGLLGAIINRAEAQVMRLAMIYALEDQSTDIRAVHLNAALALWEYCEASARWIFGDRLGDPVADTILHALRNHPQGLSRTEIRDLFGRNLRQSQIDRALETLFREGLARMKKISSGGRPQEIWFATE